MSIVFMPRQSQVDAHDIAKAVTRLSVISYIPEEDEEYEEGEDDRDELTAGQTSHEGGRGDINVQLESVVTDLQRNSSVRGSVKKKAPRWKRYLFICKKYYDRWGLKHVSPILVLFLYSLIGAGLFCIIEKQNEIDKLKETKDKNDGLREKTVVQLERILNDGTMSQETRLFAIRDLIMWYEGEVGLHKEPPMQWDMWGALFYVGTIYTTIGYGNIYCSTLGGQILTIFYAIFGIPLVLAILSDLGSLFCKWINLFWKKVKKIVGKRTEVYSKKISYGLHRGNNSTPIDEDKEMNNVDDKNKKENKEEEDLQDVPVSMAIAVMFFWLFFCSSLFLAWEREWSYFQAVYFFFISLSTIGLGDITPNKPRLMVMCFGLVIVGLSLVSMTISVIQQNIEAFLFRVLKMIQEEYQAAIEAGLIPKEDDVVDKVLKKQPWYMRKIAPIVMTQNQKKQLAEIINFTQAIMVETGTQCTSVKYVSNKDASVQVIMANSEMYTQTLEDEFESVPNEDDEVFTAPPPPVTVDTAVQTMLIPLEVLVLPANNPATPEPDASAVYSVPTGAVSASPDEPTDFAEFTFNPPVAAPPVENSVPSRPRMPSIFLQNENQEPVNISMSCVSTKDEEVQVTCASGAGGMTIVEASFAANFVDVMCQTDDSYLKLAKKLESLKVNRAKSLAIWSSPVIKTRRPAPLLDGTPE